MTLFKIFKTEGDLGDIGYGNNKIVLQRGNNSYLAAVIYGEVDNYFKSKMINAVRSIEAKILIILNGDSLKSVLNQSLMKHTLEKWWTTTLQRPCN